MTMERKAAGQALRGDSSRWAAGLLALFAILAAAVNGGLLAPVDRLLMGVGQAFSTPALDAFMVGTSLLGSVEVIGVVVVAATAWPLLRRRRPVAAHLLPLAVIIAGSIIEVLGKTLVHQPSPPGSLARGPSIGIGVATAYSFPSGHAFRATMVYGLAARRLIQGAHRHWGCLCVVLVCLIDYSRVYLGQHWPTDVLGGALLGAAGLACSVALVSRVQKVQDVTA